MEVKINFVTLNSNLRIYAFAYLFLSVFSGGRLLLLGARLLDGDHAADGGAVGACVIDVRDDFDVHACRWGWRRRHCGRRQ